MKIKTINKITALVLILTLVCLVSVAFAWFVLKEADKSALVIYTGDIDLECKVYVGNDSDKNGTLNPIDSSVDPESVTQRSSILKTYYKEASKKYEYDYGKGANDEHVGANYHEGYVSGTYLTFKVVIINRKTNQCGAQASLKFGNMEEYIYSQLEYYTATLSTANYRGSFDSAALLNSFSKSSGRIMFEFVNVNARKFRPAEDEDVNVFDAGYSELIASSYAGESGVDGVVNIPISSTIDRKLIRYSSGAYLYSNIDVEIGQLLELDFQLYCMQKSQIVSAYSNSYTLYTPTLESLLGSYNTRENKGWSIAVIRLIAENYARDIIDKEMVYLFGGDNDNSTVISDLSFTINKIYIEGKSKAAA